MAPLPLQESGKNKMNAEGYPATMTPGLIAGEFPRGWSRLDRPQAKREVMGWATWSVSFTTSLD